MLENGGNLAERAVIGPGLYRQCPLADRRQADGGIDRPAGNAIDAEPHDPRHRQRQSVEQPLPELPDAAVDVPANRLSPQFRSGMQKLRTAPVAARRDNAAAR